ncbi:hypothetical protein TSUD_218200 [Trifolium subterraneum]|uniref:Reverse transcriptase domain-containing protein n=1 Tax=Trifolium subterraneum TaxID=3900 RepID=A0A2Z6N6W8_TRISU|nr:hypothetical protein TSUD_218200 [Trifolium subterraneum]
MTRSQSVSELEKKVDDCHAELEKKVVDHHADVQVRFEQLASQMDTRMDELHTMLGKSSNHHDSDGSSGRHSSSHTPNSYATRISKVDFSRFNGKNIRDWLYNGSTHNFLDLDIAKKLGCKLEVIPPLSVTGGGGHKLEAAFICRNFKWVLQQSQLTTDVIVLPLVCCDLILGIQWLKSLGPILWDFEKLQMEFNTHGRKFVLRGAKDTGIKLINNKTLSQAVHQGAELCFLSMESPSNKFIIPTCHLLHTQVNTSTLHPDFASLVDTYKDIFAEPTALPRARLGFDHKIPLKDGVEPFNLRPYRKLNKATIKDKFPIPLIEDLMDELGGATIFSKLDMKSGYHQVRMATGEEHKTAFKTHNGHFEYLVMPFGLTNAPASFQSLMNHVFQPFLRKFVIVFFDDILIYSRSHHEHVARLALVFQTIRENNLFLNKSKCSFASLKVEYLGHFITKEGVSTDPSKIMVVSNWPQPQNLKQLRGFLGLAGYYRRFVKDFGKIAKPLTDLLKKDNFVWNEEEISAFSSLKQTLITAPVLTLPDFNKKFVVETDASGKGIGAVLMQDHHPIAYISKSLGPMQQALSVYERELLAIVYAVQKWGAYLSHAPFIIKTDQKSIKHILKQQLHTSFQQVWVAKLMGFEFEIHYKERVSNVAADALSRKTSAELLAILVNNGQTDLLGNIKASWSTDTYLQQVIRTLQANPSSYPKFSWVNGVLRRRGKLLVGNVPPLKETILQWLHDSSLGGHSGRDVTAARIKSLFYWKGMNKDIHNYVRNCGVCQQSKSDLAGSPGLIQPLPVPQKIWADISMDFIEGLPNSSGKQVILVVVDRLSKYAHFISLAHPYTAKDVARIFMDNIFKLHGDHVYIKLHPYRQVSMRSTHYHKLLPKFYGPYKVLDKIGQVAYQLDLPSSSNIHNVFHVSQLKLCPNPTVVTTQHLPAEDQLFPRIPEAIVDRKMVKRGNVAATKVLVKWKDEPVEQATWEFYDVLLHQYPNFHP